MGIFSRRSREQPQEEPVLLEFYAKDSGDELMQVELPRDEYNRLVRAAEALGVELEVFLVDTLDSLMRERNTQWVSPTVDERGNLSLNLDGFSDRE